MGKKKVRTGDRLELLRKAGVVPTDKERGIQVKQELTCIKHGAKFIASPFSYLQNTFCWSGCPSCIRNHLASGGGLKGASAWLHPAHFSYALRVRPRYAQHKFLSLDKAKKVASFRCASSGKTFLTTRPLSEFDTAMGRTDCTYCAKKIFDTRIEKITKSNRSRSPLPEGYHYTEHGKACDLHGLLSAGIGVGKRCGVCYPAKAVTGGVKRTSPEEIKAARARAKSLGIPSRETSKGVELLTCTKHRTIINAPMSRQLSWEFSCLRCSEESINHEAVGVLKKYYPALTDYTLETIRGKYRYVRVHINNHMRVLSLSSKTFQSTDRLKPIVKHYLLSEHTYYGT